MTFGKSDGSKSSLAAGRRIRLQTRYRRMSMPRSTLRPPAFGAMLGAGGAVEDAGRMLRHLKILAFFLAIVAVVFPPGAGAAASQIRVALVIGNATYGAKPFATATNDAALIAQTLQLAGFNVIGARDLDEGLLRQAFRDFIDRIAKAGPDAAALVYFAGYAMQFEGENYLVPVGADLADATNLPFGPYDCPK